MSLSVLYLEFSRFQETNLMVSSAPHASLSPASSAMRSQIERALSMTKLFQTCWATTCSILLIPTNIECAVHRMNSIVIVQHHQTIKPGSQNPNLTKKTDKL
jgi:hypothetical protein